MNMNLLAVVIPPSIYHGFFTRKTLWEEKFTTLTMKNCGCRNVRNHRDINNGEKYINLDISLNFGSLDKMKIISLGQKYYLGGSGKGLITSLGINTIRRPKKNKKARYAITNVSIKDISKIIKEFEDFTYEGYVGKSSKNVPTSSYLYISRHFSKCTTRFNMCVGPVRTQMTNTKSMNNSDMSTQKIPNLHVCSLNDSESKRINADKIESHACSTDKNETKIVIVNVCSLENSE